MKTLVTLVVVLTLTATVFGGILPTGPQASGEIRQNMELNGFSAALYASNSPESQHSWTDSETGEVYYYTSYKQSYGNFLFNMDQGFMNKNYLPMDQSTRIHRWDDDGRFYIEASFKLIFVDEVQNWINPPQASMGWNLFEINYNINTSLQHQENWSWETESSTMTNNIQGNSSFYFQDSEVTFANIYISKAQEWYEGKYLPGMRINAAFDVQYMGSQENLNILNSAIELIPVPEPTTIAILSLGGLFFRIRRI
jgi:hypothetical protein